VADTGIGIPEEVKARLFERFTQADSSTTRKYGGSGLGLAISKRLVEMMGGKIGFESVPGVGSTFWLSIPFETLTEIGSEVLPEALRGARLLVVEPHSICRAALVDLLKRPGLEVGALDNARDAAAQVAEAATEGRPYGAVLAAERLPEPGAAWLADEIQRAASNSKPVMVLLSSQSSKSREGQSGLRLSKPVTRASVFYGVLVDALAAAEKGRSGGAPAAPGRPLGEPPEADENNRWRVLVAEDSEVNQTLVVAMLAKHDCQIDLAANGVEAVKLYELHDYKLILMDCQMPEMDGLEATIEIRRRRPKGPRPIIIAVTANALQGERERCLEAGMDDFLGKPFRAAQLESLLEKWSII